MVVQNAISFFSKITKWFKDSNDNKIYIQKQTEERKVHIANTHHVYLNFSHFFPVSLV